MKRLLVVLVAAAAVAPLPAPAQQAYVQIQIRERVPSRSRPGMRVSARRDVSKMVISLKRSDGEKIERTLSLRAGESRELFWEQSPGTLRYSGEAQVAYAIGPPSKLLLDFTVRVTDQLAIWIGKRGFDLAQQVLRFAGTRRLVKAEIEVRDPHGKVLGQVTRRLGAPDTQGQYQARWSQEPGEVGKVVLTAHDGEGFWARVELVPFSIYIPHDEVAFPSGRATIRRAERPKLDRTLDLIREAIRRNADVDDIRLYVAGYTDTVAGRKYNLRLSRRRARAIARYFRRHKLTVPIFYAGYGEDALAVPTPDDTPEVKNRRAIYLLANHKPSISKHFPRDEWRRLR